MQRKERAPRSERFWARVVFFGICLCFVMTWIELERARGGNQRSWTYVVEWPLLGGITIWMVWRVAQERKNPSVRDQPVDDPEDQELQAWRAYVKQTQEPHSNQESDA